MEHVILERVLSGAAEFREAASRGARTQSCFDMHGIVFEQSCLSHNATHVTCRFLAPDAESLRIAVRQADLKYKRIWSATLHTVQPIDPTVLHDLVAVERSFGEPVAFDDVHGAERAAQWCLDAHQVTHLHSFFSIDRRRMVCFYRAPDVEAVRTAQRQAGMPADIIWPGVGHSLVNFEQAIAPFMSPPQG